MMHHENSTKHLQKLALANKREAEKQSRNVPGSITSFSGLQLSALHLAAISSFKPDWL